ncbi:TPA: hypothetical protein ACPZHQ_003853 [Yersinia enterocolitica]
MKNSTYLLILSSLLFTMGAYGDALSTVCTEAKLSFIEDVTIQLYNVNTQNSQVSIRTSHSSTTWYHVAMDNYGAKYLYDMAKTAKLTGEKVNVCYNPNGNYLIGISWANLVN